MTARPIIFSGPMVRALVEGRKTQTRRVVSERNTYFNGGDWPKGVRFADCDLSKAFVDPGPSPAGNDGPYLKVHWPYGRLDVPASDEMLMARLYPKSQSGDLLWVREAWQVPALMDIQYRADPPTRHGHWDGSRGPWRPSIHMPRWASRLTLRVTGVKVERLQDISEEDAWAEGVDETDFYDNAERKVSAGAPWAPERLAFADLWNSLHGPGSWEDNPWVAAISFEIIRANVDQVKP